MPLRQSLMVPMFLTGDVTGDALLSQLAQIGYAAVEFTFRNEATDRLISAAGRHGLAVASFVGHQSLTQGLNDPAHHDRIERELRRNIAFAAEHGAANLICFSGNRRDGQPDAEAIEITAAGLRRVAPCAEAAGVTLVLELLNSRVDHVGYQCDHTDWGVAVCQAVNSPNVKLLYDVYHMQIMEGDLIRTIQRHASWIGHVHTAGNPGRRDLDDEQELNYRAICRALAQTGYRGYVGHEFSPKADPIAAAATAFAVCQV